MAKDTSYDAVMDRRAEIMSRALGLNYDEFIISDIAFDYEGMMAKAGYSLEEVRQIQSESGVGNTPLLELRNITDLVRKTSKRGFGARILIKDEAANPVSYTHLDVYKRQPVTCVVDALRKHFLTYPSLPIDKYWVIAP